MELHKKVVCECESKSYSITEMKLYSFPKDLKYFIPEYLKENWNYIVYNTKCIHSWIAILKYVGRKNYHVLLKPSCYTICQGILLMQVFMIQVFSNICLM